MTSALTSESMLWIKAFFGNMWKFFAWITIPGTTMTVAEVLISVAAIAIIVWFLKSFTGLSTTVIKQTNRENNRNARRNNDNA